MRKQTVNLKARSRDLKMLREVLTEAQTASWRRPYRADRINALIAEIDHHRPLGPDGKHGDLHTRTCGCEDKPGWWKRLKRRAARRAGGDGHA